MSVLIKDMDIPDKCWDCELFDELAIHFTGIDLPNTDMGWCRSCKKEILDVDYKENKPLWCPLVEIPAQQWILCSEKLLNEESDVLNNGCWARLKKALSDLESNEKSYFEKGNRK